MVVTLKQSLSGIQQSITQSRSNGESDDICKEIAFEDLDLLIGQIQGATTYRALNLAKSLGKTEKKILEKVFNVISNELNESADALMDAIIDEFTKGE